MSRRHRVFALTGLVLLGGILVWMVARRDRGPEPRGGVTDTREGPVPGARTGGGDERSTPHELEGLSFQDRADPPAADSGKLRISGRIEDVVGGPIADAAIQVVAKRSTDALSAVDGSGGTADPASARATSDAEGRYGLVVEAPTPSSTRLVVRAAGYRAAVIDAVAPGEHVDVMLQRGPEIRGRVVDERGNALGGATVRWTAMPHREIRGELRTSEDGRFAIAGAASVETVAAADGFAPSYQSFFARTGSPESTITLVKGRSVAGRVLDAASGAAIEGVEVELWRYHGRGFDGEGHRSGMASRMSSDRTDQEGRFRLEGFVPTKGSPDAKVTALWITAPGWASCWQDLGDRDIVEEVTVTLFPTCSLGGRVVDDAGQAVAGLRVWAESDVQPLCITNIPEFRDSDECYWLAWMAFVRPDRFAPFHLQREAMTDGEGAFRIEGLPATADGSRIAVRATGKSDVLRSPLVRAGESVRLPDIVLAPAIPRETWRGRVHDGAGAPVGGASVRNLNEPVVTDSEGRFEFRTVQQLPNRSLEVSARGFLTEVVLVRGGEESSIDVTLRPARRLSVVVRNRQGDPLADVALKGYRAGRLREAEAAGPLAPEPMPLGRGTTDGAGQAFVGWVGDRADVVAAYPNGDKGPYRAILRDVEVSSKPLEIALDAPGSTGASIDFEIHVVDGTGAKVDAPLSAVLRRGANQLVPVFSRSSPVRLQGIASGSYDATVTADGSPPVTAAVEVGESSRSATVRLGIGSSLRGQVRTADGRTPMGVELTLARSDGVALTRATSDAEGRFRFTPVAEGAYVLSVPGITQPGARPPLRQAFVTKAKQRVQVGRHDADVAVTVVPAVWIDVFLSPAAETSATIRSGGRLTQTLNWEWARDLRLTLTDGTGTVVHEGVPTELVIPGARFSTAAEPGRYMLRVTRNGAEVHRGEVEAGKEARLVID